MNETLPWQIPFGHHPPYSYGPTHGNTPNFARLLEDYWSNPRFCLLLSGHEHNFQHHRVNGGRIHYGVSGAAGKQAGRGNNKGDVPAEVLCCEAGTTHLLFVDVTGSEIQVHPLGVGDTVPLAKLGGYPEHERILIEAKQG